MVKTETNTTHPAAFFDQPIATPHQSRQNIGSEVPIFHRDSFPPGEAKNSETFGHYHSTCFSVAWVSGRQFGDPYRVQRKPLACNNQQGTLPLRLAKCRLRRLLACIAPAGVSVSPFGLPAPPTGEPRRLRRCGRLRASPTGAVETMSLQQPTQYTPSVSPFGLTAPSEREPRRLRRSGRLRASPTVDGAR